jgi:catechol 2,3-dioxygenase-like lactoylglutathione lyase family enzyme
MATRKKGRTPTSRSRKARPPKAKSRAKTSGGIRILVQRHGPETLRLRAASPILTVNDLARSLKFYTDALGFIVKERWKADRGALQGVMLLAGVCELGLSQDDWKKGRDRKKGEGFRIWCQTAQDVDGLARRVKAAGFALTEEPRNEYDGRSFSVDDPDGFHLTIHREAP